MKSLKNHKTPGEITVAVPDFQSVMLPFLEILQDGQERLIREVTETLAVRFNLSKEEHQ